MVGDDQIDAEALRRLGRREGADAHVDADDQANAGRGGALDHIVAHVVAFANAVRHVEVGRASAEFDRGLQNDDRHGAVDVVVAVDEDRLFAFDGGVDAIDGGAQAGHLFGRVEMRERRREKALGRFRIGDAAAHEQRARECGRALATPRSAESARRRCDQEFDQVRIGGF